MQTYNATDTVTLLAKTVRVRSLLFIGPPCTSGSKVPFELWNLLLLYCSGHLCFCF